MTDTETAAHLREWVARPTHDVFAWCTDACGLGQHIRFVEHRNNHWKGGSRDEMTQFILDYADSLAPTDGLV